MLRAPREHFRPRQRFLSAACVNERARSISGNCLRSIRFSPFFAAAQTCKVSAFTAADKRRVGAHAKAALRLCETSLALKKIFLPDLKCFTVEP